MKTSRIIFMLALAAAATACNKAELEGTDPAGLKSNQFLASLEGASTKVTMANDFSLSWVAGDQVSVFGEDLKNNLFTADAAGEEVTLNGGDVIVDPVATYYAIYPYSEKNSIVAGGVITTEIPTVQTPKQGDIPVNFAVARNDGQTFTFYNVCGLVGFEITEDNIVSVTVKANGAEEYLTGKINVTPSTAPSYEVVEGVSEVTLVTDGVFEKGYHYVAVLPQAFENGITVLMAKEDGTVATKTTTKSFTLNRSHRIDTKQIDVDQSWTKLTSISNAAELQAFLAAADNYAAADVVTLAADIDLKGYDIVPAVSFAGTFDGASKSIKNWNTTTALFNEVSGTVKDLTIAESCNLEVQQQGNAAFIALANAGTISGCTNKGTVTSVSGVAFTSTEARMVGTIAAVSTGVISSCINDGSIMLTPKSINMAATQFVGGIVGQASGMSATSEFIVGCTNNGDVSLDPSESFSCRLFIGGVCGGTPAGAGEFGDYGVIKSSRNTGAITLKSKVTSSKTTYINLGGAVGYAEADLDDCDNEGDVLVDIPIEASAEENCYQRPAIAGVAGTVLYNVDNCDNSGNINVNGVFGTGTANDVGVGAFQRAYFGGVVAFAGCSLDSYVVRTCTNKGKLTLDLHMHNEQKTYAHIGGIVGNAMSSVSDCTNEGEGLSVKNMLRIGYVGGVVGLTNKAMTRCVNDAPIKYDFVNTEAVGNQSERLYLGGVAGYINVNLSGNSTAITYSSNKGAIDVVNGYYSENLLSYVGGLVGLVTKGRVCGGTTSNDAKEYVQGAMTISTPAKMYVGGIVGGLGESAASAGVYSLHRTGSITVTNPGEGSRIGGICGLRRSNNNDALVNLQAKVTINCATAASDIYAGQFYGEYVGDTNERTIHTCTMNGGFSATNVTASGIVVGLLSSGKVKIGSSGAFTIRPNKYNGDDVTTSISSADLSALLIGEAADGTNVNETKVVVED